jgi:hypothetical protein
MAGGFLQFILEPFHLLGHGIGAFEREEANFRVGVEGVVALPIHVEWFVEPLLTRIVVTQ